MTVNSHGGGRYLPTKRLVLDIMAFLVAEDVLAGLALTESMLNHGITLLGQLRLVGQGHDQGWEQLSSGGPGE